MPKTMGLEFYKDSLTLALSALLDDPLLLPPFLEDTTLRRSPPLASLLVTATLSLGPNETDFETTVCLVGVFVPVLLDCP